MYQCFKYNIKYMQICAELQVFWMESYNMIEIEPIDCASLIFRYVTFYNDIT